MKKIAIITRKHGYKARAATIARRLELFCERHLESAPVGARLKTVLTFESKAQAYLWITDRGRSKLIKH